MLTGQKPSVSLYVYIKEDARGRLSSYDCQVIMVGQVAPVLKGYRSFPMLPGETVSDTIIRVSISTQLALF